MNQIVITTYNRVEHVTNLVKQIRSLCDYEVTVFNDGGEVPKIECDVISYYPNGGKRKYYELVTKVFEYLRNKDFKYFWMLPDDVVLDNDIFTATPAIWDAIKDERKICLSVGHTHNRHYRPCWTNFTPVKIGDVVLTNWNDLCFMAERKFLEELNYRIERPAPGYDYRSSGVGRYISRYLYSKHWNMYHTDKSYCHFIPIETKMHI